MSYKIHTNDNTILHSDIYMGTDFSEGFKHWKYIKRYKGKNGKWQYVYADKNNPDTDDSLTWRKDGERYLINLEDRDVTNPLTAAFDNNKLVITGSNGCNTETFQKVNEELNLQQFLNDMHKK